MADASRHRVDVGGVATGFVGRQREVAYLRSALDRATSGEPRTVLVEGPEGIGKTTLLRRFAGETGARVVLRASGEEMEADLPYGVLDQLRSAAGARPADGVGDPQVEGTAFLRLLGELQARGPVAVLLDDAHWADTPSLQALLFSLGRLGAERVLAVAAVADAEAWRLPRGVGRLVDAGRASRLRLDGLSAEELADLAVGLGTGELSPWAAWRLREHTAGNPRWAAALVRELGPSELGRPGPDLLPAPRVVADRTRERMGACSAGARRLVEAGSVLGERFDRGLAARLARAEDAAAAASDAVMAGIVHEASPPGGSLSFAHPLVRAAVYHALGPARRAELHRRAAESVGDGGAALRHRAAAATGPDAALARSLDEDAARRARAGDWQAAAGGRLLAARLGPAGPERDQRLIEAFEDLTAAGDLSAADAVTEDLEGSEAPRTYVRGAQSWCAGRVDEAERLLQRVLGGSDPGSERRLVAHAAARLATLRLVAGRSTEARDLAARSLAADTEAVSATLARSTLLTGLGAAGNAAEGLAMAQAPLDPVTGCGPAEIGDLLGRGVLGLWTDDLAGAERDLCAATANDAAPLTATVGGLVHLSDARYRRGRWDQAVADGGRAVSAAGEGRFALVLAEAHAVASFALAARGDIRRAEAHVGAASLAARAVGSLSAVLHAAVAEARVALAAGDVERQCAACEPLMALSGRDLIDEPGVQPWRELLAEALVRVGRLDEAEAVLVPLEERGAARGLASARSGAARVRGLLEAGRGNVTAAAAAFEAALADAARVDMPFLRAQAELAFGAFLRRRGRRRAALGHLQAARQLFERLAARPFLERCDRELAGLGLAPVRRDAGPVLHLTPQERSVAHHVASGLSNREVAAALAVSVKTVEYHLGNVFAKLGVRSRAQLAARLGGPDTGPAA